MIVTIAAWLNIVYAVLMLGSLLVSPWGFNGIEGLGTLALAGLYGAMGVGLLKRLPWARWLALGSSLIAWVLGSLLLILAIGYLVVAASAAMLLSAFGGGVLSFIGLMTLFGLLLWVAGVVINFKLFWYLCSEQGCAEFGVPHGSTQTVIASCGTWVGIFIVNIMASDGGQAMQAMMREKDANAGAQAQYPAAPAADEDYAARRARSEAMLREQAELEAARAAGIDVEPEESDESESESESESGTEAQTETAADEASENYTIDESPVPTLETTSGSAEDSEEETRPRILKCVDASGGTIFTQGYCPPGSKPVRAPATP